MVMNQNTKNLHKILRLAKDLNNGKNVDEYKNLQELNQLSSQVMNNIKNTHHYLVICFHVKRSKIWSLYMKSSTNRPTIMSLYPREIINNYKQCLFDNKEANKICHKHPKYHKVSKNFVNKLMDKQG